MKVIAPTAISVLQRARAYVAKIPNAVAGQGGHNRTFATACALVHGFALSEVDVIGLLREYNTRCEPPWSESEVTHKVQSALNAAHAKPRGHLIGQRFKGERSMGVHRPIVAAHVQRPRRVAKVEYDEAKLRALAAKLPRANEEWLWERSPIRPECMSPAAFLMKLYPPSECVHIFTGQGVLAGTVRITEPPFDCRVLNRFTQGHQDVFFLLNPVDGKWHPNPRKGGLSNRSEESVTSFRFALLESDNAPADLWLSALAQMPIRIAAIYTSGGRSIHALWQVNAATKAEWDAQVVHRKAALKILGADAGSLTSVRLSRLPQCERKSKGGFQKLLYLNPNPPEAALAKMPIRETGPAMLARFKSYDYTPPNSDNPADY